MTRNTILGSPSSGPETTARTDSSRDDDAFELEYPGDAETAAHRSQLYALLALGFERPGDDLEAAIADDAFTDGAAASAETIDPSVADAATALPRSLEDADSLSSEWAPLFGVEEGITVSPYEVVYMPGPLMTNIRKIADIRGFYDAFGLSVTSGQNDRPDHLCFMLEFLAYLCHQEAFLRETDDREGVAIVVDAQRRFLEDHLGRWYWRFVDEVTARDDGFYAALAEVLAALVESDIDRLQLEPEWVPDDPAVTEWNEDIFGDTGRDCGGCGMGEGEPIDPSVGDGFEHGSSIPTSDTIGIGGYSTPEPNGDDTETDQER